MSVLAVHLNPHHGFSKMPQPSIKLLKGLGVAGDCHLGKTTQHLWRLKQYASEPNLRQVHLLQSELLDEPDFHGDDGVRVQPGQMGENITTAGIDLLALGNGTKLHFVDKEKEHTRPARDGLKACMNTSLLVALVGFGAVVASLGGGCSFRSLVMGAVAYLCLVMLTCLWYTKKSYFEQHAVITVTGVRHPCKKVEQFRSGLKEKCVVRGDKNGIIKRKAGIMAVITRAGTVKPGMTIVVETTGNFEELPVLP